MTRTMPALLGMVFAWGVPLYVIAQEEAWTHHFHTLEDGTKLHNVEMGKSTPVFQISAPRVPVTAPI